MFTCPPNWHTVNKVRARRGLAALLIPLGAVTLGVAQIAVHPSSATASSSAPVQSGTAAAGANLLGVSPGVSGLSLTTSIGESTAALEHDESQAKSATVDLGSLGLVLATSTFCGKSELPMSEQPQPLSADSENGAGTTNKSQGIGSEQVSISKTPESATATTTMLSESIPGVLEVSGTSVATVKYVAGTAQVASGKVNEDISLLGGKVKLEGLSWRADRSAGRTQSHSTGFSFGDIVINGKPIKSAGSPAAGIAAVNNVLAPFGLSLVVPTQRTNHDTGAVTIGPMTLRFSGSKVDRTLLGPAINSVVTLEDLLKSQSTAGSDCKDIHQLLFNLGTSSETLLNVFLEISEGAGDLDLNFGGASASALNQASYANPFGGDGANSNPLATGGSTTTTTGTTQGSSGSSVVLPSTRAARPPAAGSPQVASQPQSTLAAAVKCESTSPAGPHHCWRGVATIASGGALAVGGGLLVADLYFSRRGRPQLRRRYRRV